jgi:pimeloyl-ACP methyl ester carboxylesterase
MERHFVKTSLGQVHVVGAGQGAGPPVVLMHQTPRSTDEFAEVIPLVAMRHRVLAIDNPGYGCSDHPEEQPSVEQYCEVILEVLDHFEAQSAHLVGHHTGAILAVEIAAARPDRVAKIVLSGPVYMDEESRRELGKVFVQWHVRADGSHLTEKWEKFSQWTATPKLVHRILKDLLRAGETSEFGHFGRRFWFSAPRIRSVTPRRAESSPKRFPTVERFSWRAGSSCRRRSPRPLPRQCSIFSSLHYS